MTGAPTPFEPQQPGAIHRASRGLIRLHDKLYSHANRAVLKKLAVQVSILGFAVHLLLIFLANVMAHPPLIASAAGTNYLAAISTPFNIILFYEVLTLIAALPSSTTRSIANQFEIVSLIFIRDAFKDMSELGGPDWLHGHLQQAMPLVFDMAAGMAMFFLVSIFQHVALRQVQMPATAEFAEGRAKFMMQKKVIAVGLTILLIGLAAFHLALIASNTWHAVQVNGSVTIEPTSLFYNDVFTVMVFTDVLVLILSLVLTGRYEMVFRNAAYVISIILIRFSLTESRPWGAALALIAAAFAILTSLVFNYHSRVRVAGGTI